MSTTHSSSKIRTIACVFAMCFALLHAGNLSAQTYCTATTTTPCTYMWTNNFSTTGGIANITNNSSGCSAAGYGDYTAMIVAQAAGSSFNFSVQGNPSFTQGFTMWIDWNNNMLFTDAGEMVWNSGTYGVGPFTGTITIPAGTSYGTKRMRVRGDYSTIPTSPCAALVYGETEDYLVYVTGGATYCSTLYTTGCTYGDNIQNVTISTLNQTATGCTGGTGYADYTAMTVPLLQGNVYPYTITSDFPSNEYVGWWIDLNDNSLFSDSGEFIGGTGPGGATITGNVTIPATATPGTHRMRLRLVYGTPQNLYTSCTQYTYGETHDYTAEVTTGCTGAPTGGSATAYPSNFCAAPAYIYLNDPTASTGAGIVYKWQSAPPPGTSWTNITGATTLPYTATATATTYYRLAVKCTTSGIVSYSTPVLVTMMGGTEICNGLDDDCDGAVDDGVVESASISAGGATTFCMGGSVLLTATYTGTTIQWRKDGVNITGATVSTYTATASGSYTAMTTSACSYAISSGITVSVNNNPSAVVTAGGPTTFCAGGSVTLTESPSGGVTYQWYKGASAIAGATTNVYVATIAGSYKCRVTKTATGCFKNSNAVVVTVPCRDGEFINNGTIEIYPNPAANVFTVSAQLAGAGNVILEIYSEFGQLIYTQEENSIDGTINESLNLENIASGIYLVKLKNENQSLSQKLVIEK